jgi:hypothetical protein
MKFIFSGLALPATGAWARHLPDQQEDGSPDQVRGDRTIKASARRLLEIYD